MTTAVAPAPAAAPVLVRVPAPAPAVAPAPAAVRRPAAVFPLLSTRVTALGPADLEPLAGPALTEALTALRTGREAAAEAADALSDVLYALVPTLDENPAVRRAALRLRRDTRHARGGPRTAEAAAAVRPALDAAGQAVLTSWTGAAKRFAAAADHAERLVEADARAAGSWMLGLLRRPDLAAGLALASPAFTRELLRADPAKPPAPGSRLARSALSYLTRTAIKTSPFGSLVTLGLASLGPAPVPVPAPAAGPAPAADTVSPRHLAVELLRAFAADPDLSDAVELRVNPSLHRLAGTWQVLLPQYVNHALPYHSDLLATADLYAPFLAPAGDGSGPADDRSGPPALWSGHGTPGERARARRWAAMGLLLPDVPWQPHDRHCLAALADRTGTPPGPQGPRIAGALAVLADTERALPAADAATRLRLDGRARDAAADVFTALGTPQPHWLASAPLFHQNVPATDTPVPVLPAAEIEHDLRALGRRVRAQTFRSALYDVLTAHFTGRYGTGGTCHDLYDFLYSFCRREDHHRLVARAAEADRAGTGTPRVPVPAGTVGAAAVTVFHQLAATDAAALARGEYLMAVNRVSPGAGGLLARWGAVPGTGEAIREPLRRWIGDLYPGCVVLQLTAGGDYSTLQAPAGPLFPYLRWPSDLRASATAAKRGPHGGPYDGPGDGPGPGLDLTDLVLSHDPASDTLQLYDRHGASVALPYLGVMPPHVLSGPVRVLATLSQPWNTRYLTNGERLPHDPTRPPPAGVTATARAREGRLVTARASWRLPGAALPRPQTGEGTAAFLDRLDGWRREHGIPQQCFVRAEGTRGALPEKPFWTHLGSPHAVASLLKTLGPDAAAVEFTELLPGPGTHWLTDTGGRPRAVELAALLRLDQPDTEEAPR
ncbi:hypothetical protein [Streptomyces sp. NPDC059411]|uniref:hypothetical protein n=1 Tax=Streptomyces sp. NPDC059411 TaxID=3346825 RepID=UPI00368ABC23